MPVLTIAPKPWREPKCLGLRRDKDNITAVQLYFSRPLTDDEMRFLRLVVERASACMPRTPS